MEYQDLAYIKAQSTERFDLGKDAFESETQRLPTWAIVVEGLRLLQQSKDYDNAFQNITVFPQGVKDGKVMPAVTFPQDSWSCSWYDGDARNINFSKLSGRLKFEAKLFAMAELWLFKRDSKLSSLTRKCTEITNVAEKCSELGILSLTHLGQETIALKLYDSFREDISHNSTRNKFIALNGLSDAYYYPLKDYGFFTTKDLKEYVDARSGGNQTFAMPFSIMAKVWRSLHDFAINVRTDYLKDALPIIKMMAKFSSENPGVSRDVTRSKNKKWITHLGSPEKQKLLREFNEKYPNKGVVDRRKEFPLERYDIPPGADRALRKQLNSAKRKEIRLREQGLEFSINAQSFATPLHVISNLLVLGIQSFTGMRESEVKAVTLGSLVVDRQAGYIGVDSNLFKFAPEGGIEDVWAAAPWVEECFTTLRMIAKATYYGFSESEIDDVPALFNIVSAISHRGVEKRKGRSNKEYVEPTTKYLVRKYDIRVTDEDVKEFFRLNRNIGNIEKIKEEIIVGECWPLKSHQFRRSIACHTKRLSAASDRAISFQLKHRQRSQTDWYSDGGAANSALLGDASHRLYKLWKDEEAIVMAETSVDLQNTKNVFGKGGELLKSTQDSDDKAKLYPSIKKAKQMASRGKSALKALGHGLYCLDGNNCKMKAVMQSSNCNIKCDNLAADDDAIEYHKHRMKYYEQLIDSSIPHNRTEAQIEYLKLEYESHKEFLTYFGVL